MIGSYKYLMLAFAFSSVIYGWIDVLTLPVTALGNGIPISLTVIKKKIFNGKTKSPPRVLQNPIFTLPVRDIKKWSTTKLLSLK
uniref:Serpentine receptor class gamma n=1 Tax=Caenorhabditis tropicalis TaxID=1561998 RepID=A0A1I7U4U2_9PELO